MDQRSDYIRQDIEDTRAALDEKLDSLETKARQAFDLNHQVAERPWLALGAAVAAGYVLGSLGGAETAEQRWQGTPTITTDYNQHAGTTSSTPHAASTPATPSGSSFGDTIRSATDSFMAQFDDEIDMLKSAAIAALTNFLHDSIREYAPALGRQFDQTARERGKTVSTAPGAAGAALSGASKYYDVRESSTTLNHESIPQTTTYGSNVADRNAEHATPYYPPGSSGAQSEPDYVKTYHPASESTRERSVGEDRTRY